MAFYSSHLESSAPICYINIDLRIVPLGITCVVKALDLACICVCSPCTVLSFP